MNLIIFDLETTGLSPVEHEIIQIAAVRIQAGSWEIGEAFDSFVRPKSNVPEMITKLTGITQRDVESAPAERDALLEFSRFVGAEATLVAHNGLRFDMRFIHEACLRQQIAVRETPVVDSREFSRKIWGGRGGHDLDAILGRLSISSQGMQRHNARSDVQLLAQAVRVMWEKLSPGSSDCPVAKGTGVIPRLA
ncbi:MAG: 3'-5' exonuclease [Prosthecobacter sp.]|nr:3'-5' exonuclease [Prosthecobacter sp.]